MTSYQVSSTRDPISEPVLFDQYRPTIVMLLIADEGRSIVLVEHEKGRPNCFIPPQGGIRMGESLCRALQREVTEELPGVRVIFDSSKYLFTRVNEIPPERHETSESSKNKLMFWVAATVIDIPKDVQSAEIRRARRVFSLAELEGWLDTGLVRPHKRHMILKAVEHARKIDMLKGNFAARMVA